MGAAWRGALGRGALAETAGTGYASDCGDLDSQRSLKAGVQAVGRRAPQIGPAGGQETAILARAAGARQQPP